MLWSKENPFSSKTALVTGASSGIGKEFSLLLARAGCSLILTGRRLKLLEELKDIVDHEYDVPCHIIISDLSTINGIKDLIRFVEELNLTVDVLVNNAGFATYGYFHKLDLNRQLEELQVNVTTPVYLSYYFLKRMLERDEGWILNVASTAALLPSCPFEAIYGGTKSFLFGFSLALSHEYKGSNVHIACLLPGNTNTDFWKEKNLNRKYGNKLKLMASPEKVAQFGINLLLSRKVYGIFEKKVRFKAVLLRLLPTYLVNTIVRKMHYEKYLEE